MELSPLLVTVFVSTTDYERRDVPANITELFKKYTEMMLGRWDGTKRLGLQYQAPLKDFVLRQVAFAMHREEKVDIGMGELKNLIARELADRGHEASVEVLTDEIIGRSGLFRQVGDRVEFRHHLLQEFFAGRAIDSQDFLDSVIANDWWRRAIVFYFGENPSDGNALERAKRAVVDRVGPERYRAALTLGLSVQACYLVPVEQRKEVLAWIIGTLAESRDGMVEALVGAGHGSLFSMVHYYMLSRDSVAAQIMGRHHREIAEAVARETGTECGEVGEFWVIAGLIEAGFLDEARQRIEAFETEDATLLYMLYLGCLLIRELRATSRLDKEGADRVVRMLSPYVEGLREKMLKEVTSELLELRGGMIKPVDGSDDTERDDGIEEGIDGQKGAE